MTQQQALDITTRVAAGRCAVTIHKGTTRMDRAIRLSGLDQRDARQIGQEIADKMYGAYRESPGFVAVWYPVNVPVERLPK